MKLKSYKTLIFCLILVSFSFKQDNSFFQKLVVQAINQTKIKVTYVPAYVQIKYPNGDVPVNTGVCTDLVIRAYRGVGIDLQKEVHEDMVKNFKDYPKLWSLKSPDSNIDHRRVPNLMTYFKKKKSDVLISDKAEDYKPGDLVTWNLQGKKVVSGITHIGIVTDQKTADGKRYLIAHNIGGGNTLEDMLFSYVIIGHYRFKG
ncbi:MAG: DUF1287 domain-containing protein [Bacteroidetes bacterium]|nr:DUF1287 domain-containing protein [Bacteroidota bacterium]